MAMTRWLMLGALMAAGAPHAAAQAPTAPPSETAARFAARTRWWREARLGMFIHWGLYAVPADATGADGKTHAYGEWYLSNKQMQEAEYARFASRFRPDAFDARAWVKAAKDAGMKYIVVTSKHHDGFAMFDSKVSQYDVVDATPFRRDPIRELADECRRQGIRLCFYYSVMDWHNPDYLPRRPWETKTRPAAGADLNRYTDFMKAQLTELLTNYGPVGIIWFDGSWEHSAEELRAAEVVAHIRRLQPGVLINDRIQRPEDYATPEQTIPVSALPAGRLWETCMTMNTTWGYARNDQNWKSASELVRNLCDIASKGGNFLLNVGPMDTGAFTPETSALLTQMGAWMKANGMAIYGTEKNPLRRVGFDGRVTAKGNRLYLHVFQWPENGLRVTGLKNKVLSARVLETGQSLAVSAVDRGFAVARPSRLHPIATVVEVRLDRPADVEDVPVTADASGVFALEAPDAVLSGGQRLEAYAGAPSIGYWTDAKDAAAWIMDVARPGRYRVALEYSCAPGFEGSTFRVEGGGGALRGTVTNTGAWDRFRSVDVKGALVLASGRQTLRVAPETMPGGAVMNLRRITLTPLP